MVALGAALAIFLSGQPLLVLHTAVTALLVVALGITTTTGDLSPDDPDRFFEALIGSGVALVVNALLPVNPELRVERAVHPIFSELVATLEEIAAALAGRDLDRAERALQRASEMNKRMAGFKEALAAGYETARFSPPRRRELRHLELPTPPRPPRSIWPLPTWRALRAQPYAPCDATAPPWRGHRRPSSTWLGRWRP
jgi:uncharacterized membrane protein YgaE (UPF0421/DUF939 family)